MIKLIHSASFFQEHDAHMALINLRETSFDGLEKTAADQQITNYVSNFLKPKEGKFYLHINALGAGEYYGANRNADFFPAANLKECYKTFEETGYIYRHHLNKDPSKAMGKVLHAIYNDRMHRVELIAELDMILAKDIYDRIQAGDYPSTSMACKTAYDVCSICGNKAHTRQEYCVHLTTQLNRVLPNGQKVMALNLAPLRFIDQSIVIKPADVTSSVLQKVAFEVSECFLSIDAAIEEGLVEQELEKKAEKIKQAAFRKLSELVKTIEGGQITAAGKSVEELMKGLREPGEDLLDILSAVPLDESLNALAELGMSPSISFLATLIARKAYGNTLPVGFGDVVEDFVTNVSPGRISLASMDLLGHIEEKAASPHLMNAIAKRSDSSLLPDRIEKRAYNSRYYGGSLDTLGDLPHYDNRSKEERRLIRERVEAEARDRNLKDGTNTTLLSIGGAAVLAKMVLTSLLEEKLSKSNMMRLKYSGVIKSASVSELMDGSVYYSYYVNSGQRG